MLLVLALERAAARRRDANTKAGRRNVAASWAQSVGSTAAVNATLLALVAVLP